MNMMLGRHLRVLAVCLIFAPILGLAQAADRDRSSCSAGTEACTYAAPQQSQMDDLARAEHRRNLTNCRDAEPSCDRSRLTPA